MSRVLCAMWLLLGLPVASAMDTDAFIAQMNDMQRSYGNVVVAVRGRDAEVLHQVLAEQPVYGVSFRLVAPSKARKVVRRAGSDCGLLATPIPSGWRTTLLGACSVTESPSLSQAYAGGHLRVEEGAVVSAAGELTPMEIALRFGDSDTLTELQERRRRAQRAGKVFLGAGLVLGRGVGPIVSAGAIGAILFGRGDGEVTRRAWILAGVGASISLVGYVLAASGGILVARGGQARRKLHLFYSQAELQAGVDAHNDDLADQLGYERGASLQRPDGLQWALHVTAAGPVMAGRF